MHTYIQTLTKLNLADNNLGPEGTQFLAELLEQNEVYLNNSFHFSLNYII